MALIYSSKNVEHVYYNGVELSQIYYNGTLVWKKTTTPDVPSIEYEDCWECDGAGHFACTACDKGTCIVCGGTGYTTAQSCAYCDEGECWNCSGSGKVSGGCTVCYGTGDNPCGKCDRKGYYYGCGACGSEMTYSNNTWFCGRCNANRAAADEIRCPICDGAGFLESSCYNCSGTGTALETCSICNGAGGPCTYCNGQHQIYGGQCSNCSGTGNCPICDAGVITCDRCNGTGQVEAFKTTYDASSGSVTFTLRNGEQLLAERTSTYPETWLFSSNFSLALLTYNNEEAPRHWGYSEITPSLIGGVDQVWIYEFDKYTSYDGNSFWDYSGDGCLEGEFIAHRGERVATLTYDEDAQIWTIS